MVYQQALQSAAIFVASYEQFKSMGHALMKKFPKYESRIAMLTGNMYKKTYTSTIDNIKSRLKQSYFDFDE